MNTTLIDNKTIENVTRENFIDIQDQLCFSPVLIDAHNEWESIDQEWKDLKKEEAAPDSLLLSSAAKVRVSKDYKDTLYDEAAILAEKIASKTGILEEYLGDTLGGASIIEEVEEGSLEWLNMRRQGVGGSSIMEALGFHWKSRPGDPVYMRKEEKIAHWQQMGVEKSTEIVEMQDNFSGVLFRGHKWEPSLIVRYAIENNVRVGISKATWKGKHPLQVVNVDGLVLDDNGVPVGLIECKTSSREWTWKWGVPMHYRAQVLWYLEAFELEWADVLVKFDTGYIETFRIKRGETIDGTNRTKPITEYYGELEDNWNTYVQPYKDNPDNIWNIGAPLAERYGKLDDVIPDVDTNDKFLDILEKSDIIKVDILSPYERMPRKYDIVTGFETTSSGGKITLDGVSPAYYPVDHEYMFSSPSPREDTYLEQYINSKIVLALDEVTYNYLHHYLNWPNIVNLSDIRRLVDMKPGWLDFHTIDQAIDWLNDYLQG